MLTHLAVRDVVLIARLDAPLAPGLTVMTGETGAGKSIILDALALVLGARSDARLVRAGQPMASVTAQFALNKKNPVPAILADHGIEAGDELILRRVVQADGKSKAFANDQPIGAGLLKSIAAHLVDVHGQFDNHGLLDPSTHAALLDRFGQHEKMLNAVAAAHADWQAKLDALSALRAEAEAAAQQESFLRAAVAELEDLSPGEGEEEALAARRTLLQQQEKLFEVLRQVNTDLGEAENQISNSRRAADKLSTKTGEFLLPLSSSLDNLYDALASAQDTADRLLRSLGGEEDTSLEQAEVRLFGLRAAARKYRCTVNELADKRREFTQALMLVEDQGDFVQRLEKETAAARAAYALAAEKLSAARQVASEKLARFVQKELAPLRLEKAKFSVEISALPEAQWSAKGTDSIRFMVVMNAGQSPAPLHKTASGGEMARLLLAMKGVLAKNENIPVLVFDEVDTGIGGAAADAVGERLQALSRAAQVLVITHSPQVAARADHHWRVMKSTSGKTTVTDVAVLTEAERQDEIARMLSGAEITPEARAAAGKLLGRI